MEWGKTLAAMVTPMDAGGGVDLEGAVGLARDIMARGVEGLVLSGTTGEAATLSAEEKLALAEAVGRALGGQGQIIAGVGGCSTRETVALVRRMEEKPIQAYMVITPYYNKPNRGGLIAHYQAVAQASSRPLMLYNVPSRTGLDLSREDYQVLLRACPEIRAVKEAGTDLAKGAWLADSFPEVGFYSGSDDLVLPLVALGFRGVVSVAANVVPAAMAQLTAWACQGEGARARALYNRLAPLFAALFVETNPVPVKAALELQGWPVGAPRLPLVRLSEENRQNLAALLQGYSREGL